MSFRSLRWLTIIGPAVFLIVLEIVRAYLIEPVLPGPYAHLVGAPIVLVGILLFSVWVFRRLEAQQQRILDQNRALEALNAAGMSLTADLAIGSVLQRVVNESRALSGARYAALGVLDDEGQLAQFVTSGLTPEEQARIGQLPRGDGLLGILLQEPRPLRIARIGEDPRSAGFCANHPLMTSFLGVPIIARGRAIGNLYLSDKAEGGEFSEQDEAAVVTLASQASIAIENARLYQQIQRLAAVEERERIGRELHDGVIQSIYGAGLALDDAVHTVSRDPVGGQEKVRRVMAMLDRTIGEIRSFIMGLEDQGGEGELRRRLEELVEEYRPAGPPITLDVRGRPGQRVSAEVNRQLLQAARESLANAIQHADASTIVVSLEYGPDTLLLAVTDDGRGFELDGDERASAPGRGRGLANLRERSRELGGTLRIESAPGKGTRVSALVPYSQR